MIRRIYRIVQFLTLIGKKKRKKKAVVNVTLRSPFPVFPLPMVDPTLIRNITLSSLSSKSLNTFRSVVQSLHPFSHLPLSSLTSFLTGVFTRAFLSILTAWQSVSYRWQRIDSLDMWLVLCGFIHVTVRSKRDYVWHKVPYHVWSYVFHRCALLCVNLRVRWVLYRFKNVPYSLYSKISIDCSQTPTASFRNEIFFYIYVL